MRGATWLLYHEVAPDERPPSAGEAYALSASTFDEHLDAIAKSGRPVMGATEWLLTLREDAVVITFDDGEQDQLEVGVPMVAARGWTATLFATWDFIERYGLERGLADAAGAGAEIGVHGLTHDLLDAMPPTRVHHELAECRRRLEDVVGQPVESGAAPGGAWGPHLASIAASAGLRLMCTSRPGVNTWRTNPYALRRFTVRSGMGGAEIERALAGDLAGERRRYVALRTARRLIGARSYRALSSARARLAERRE